MRRQARVVHLADTRDRSPGTRRRACAFALCRAIRSGSVFSPRPSAYAGCGSITVPEQPPRLLDRRRAAPCDPVTTPPVTSLWPFRYFVALCIARSTPSASGCWLIGLAKVLSMTDSTPRARQAAAIRRTSTQRSVGLIGDSNQTIRVRSPMTRSGCGQLARARRSAATTPKRRADRSAGAACRRRSPRRRRPRRPPSGAPSGSSPSRHAGREQQRRLRAVERGELLLDARRPSGCA